MESAGTMLQKTIKDEVRLAGKGLFGGEEVKVTFRPAEADTGVIFIRTDLAERVVIPALAANIAERARRTALQNGEASVETPEHCLAAISALLWLKIDPTKPLVSDEELAKADAAA